MSEHIHTTKTYTLYAIGIYAYITLHNHNIVKSH
jgi:hypothetical protein